MSPPRVCLVPEYPLSLMTGGTLVQAVETRQELARHLPEMTFELFSWSDQSTPADCYHFIGLPGYLGTIVGLVRQAGKPYVLTLLFGGRGTRTRLWMAAWRRKLAGGLGWQREHHHAIHYASAVVAITAADAEAAATIYQLPRSRIQLVEVAVHERFFDPSPDLWRSQYGAADFVLSVGALQKRKNQLLLAEACTELKLPLVLVGGVLGGQEDYARQVSLAMQANQKLGGQWLQCDNRMLASAYGGCRLFCLLSSSETQPASVLQAMAARKPVLLAEAPYATQHPFASLPKVSLNSRAAVVAALSRSWNEATGTKLPGQFCWDAVSRKLGAIYAGALSVKPGGPTVG